MMDTLPKNRMEAGAMKKNSSVITGRERAKVELHEAMTNMSTSSETRTFH